jgi:hypothetical protein
MIVLCQIVMMAWIVVLVTACTNERGSVQQSASADLTTAREHASQFYPKDAVHVGSAAEVSWVQESFEVARKPFEFAVGVEELGLARSAGWMVCQQLDPQWMSFEDATVTPARHVQQKAYVLHGQGTLITLVGRHYGGNDLALARQLETADTVTQHFAVIARPAAVQAAEEAADSLGLSCDQTAPLR